VQHSVRRENHRLTSNALVVKHAAATKNIQAYF